MLRLLRRRQGILLAVFGTVLMILMLADQSIYGLMGRLFSGSGTWATIGDRSISSEARAQLARELEVLDRVGWMGIGAGPLGVIEDPAHWLLLTEMARNAGFTTGSLATEMQEAELAQVYTAAGRTPEVDRALSNLFGVIRMFGAMANSPTLSDRRLIRDASSIFGGADCRLMVLEAQATGDEPSDEAIASHFETYRDVEPSDPEQAFGYRLPDRVAVDWFTLPANVIEDAARASEAMDTIAVLKHWKTNPRGRAFPAYDASIEVPEVVIDDLLAIETDALFDRVDRRLSSTLLEARRDLKTTPEGAFKLPENWSETRPSLSDLAQLVAQEISVDAPEVESAELKAVLDYSDLPGFPIAATTPAFGQPKTARDYLTGLRDFELGPLTLPAQSQMHSPVFRDPDGGLVVMLPTQADGKRAAERLEEIGRETVVGDLKRLADYESRVAELEALRSQILADGMLATALALGDELERSRTVRPGDPNLMSMMLQQGNSLPAGFRGATPLPVVGTNDDVLKTIAEVANTLPLDETAFAAVPLDDRLVIEAVDTALAIVVAEIQFPTPLDQEVLTRLSNTSSLESTILGENFSADNEALVEAFSFEALSERMNFQRLGLEDSEDTLESTDPESTESSASTTAG